IELVEITPSISLEPSTPLEFQADVDLPTPTNTKQESDAFIIQIMNSVEEDIEEKSKSKINENKLVTHHHQRRRSTSRNIFTKVPNDVLHHIFSFLDFDEIYKLSLVNHHFYEVACK